MRNEDNFDNLTVGEHVLVEHYGYERGYYQGTVTKVTKTRFTVKYAGEREQTFTKDGGYEYPRSTGYGRSYVYVKLMTTEGLGLIKKCRLASKARNLAAKLNDIFDNSNFRNQMSSLELTSEELDESIQLLEQTYERFKKYGPKETT